MAHSALVTGATGLLGRQVLKAFEDADWKVTGAGFSRSAPPRILKVDIQNEDEVVKALDEIKPSVVVHCAADRQPDSCTKNPEGARRLNVTATSTLAASTASRGIFLIYISTDYVFPGQPGDAPYKATDQPKPTNIYGETKLDGEKAVLQDSPTGVILRVPVLYGHTDPDDNNKESAVNVLMDALNKSQKEQVKMDDWAIRYPTNTQDVARVCIDISKLYLSSNKAQELPRILQFSSEDKMTKYEIIQKFADIMGLPFDNVIPDKDGGKPAADGTLRPYDCHLSSDVLKDLGIDVGTMDFVAWWRWKVKAYRH